MAALLLPAACSNGGGFAPSDQQMTQFEDGKTTVVQVIQQLGPL
jgi:hypothetical protein